MIGAGEQVVLPKKGPYECGRRCSVTDKFSTAKAVELPKAEVSGIVEALEDISVRDGKLGFSRAETRAAAALLVKKGIIAKPSSLDAASLTRLFLKLRRLGERIPAKRTECDHQRGSIDDLVWRWPQCKTIEYSARICVKEGRAGVSLEELSIGPKGADECVRQFFGFMAPSTVKILPMDPSKLPPWNIIDF
jgi:hypothetical protein